MKEERMKILEMLEANKITAEEAGNLLQQIPSRENPQMPQGSNLFTWIKDTVLNPLGYKMKAGFESNPINDEIKTLILSGLNGKLTIEGHNSNRITIRCEYHTKNPDSPVSFFEENGVYELKYDRSVVRSMKISCRVPLVMIEKIQAESSNGSVKLENIRAQVIEGESSNGKISLERVNATASQLSTSNGSIKIRGGDLSDISAKTSNGSVKIEGMKDSNQPKKHRISAETSNGSVLLELPRNLGIKLYASTSNGSVNQDLEDALQGEMSRTFIDAKNNQYEDTGNASGSKADIKLSTSNGSVTVRNVL